MLSLFRYSVKTSCKKSMQTEPSMEEVVVDIHFDYSDKT